MKELKNERNLAAAKLPEGERNGRHSSQNRSVAVVVLSSRHHVIAKKRSTSAVCRRRRARRSLQQHLQGRQIWLSSQVR